MRACLLPLTVLVCLGAWLRLAAGQADAPSAQNPLVDPPTAGGTPAPRATAGGTPTPRVTAVEASQLDTFMLRDGKGNLVPVLGLPFEEFEQLLRTKKGLGPQAGPSYTIESLSLVGTAGEEIAELQLTATIRVREAGWVRVPLLMPKAVIRGPAKHEGVGEHFVSFDDEAGGYVCWLKGDDARPHVVSMPISVGVHTVGEERTVSIALPRATESSLRLTTPQAGVEAGLAKGEGIATARASGANRTEIFVLGAAGDLQLGWRPKRGVATSESSQLDASGEVAVRIQSERRITCEARLRVRSYGGPLEQFRVRLPAGMELLPLPASAGYSVTPATSPPGNSGSASERDDSQVVLVRLDRPAVGPAEVVLRVQRQAELGPAVPLAPAKFEVLGAARQRGTIDFLMDGEWQLDWTEDNTVHRIDLTPDLAANVVARYEYFQQPCGLALDVSPRPSRITVEPTHTVFVDPERVRIETTLKYRLRGARAAGISFELGDWTFDRLLPDTLLEAPANDGEGDGRMQIPFRAGAAPGAELELKLEAHRTLPAGGDRLSLRFPQPIADFVAPATIVISAADNVELTPQATELIGLAADPTTVRLPGRQQPAIVYRDLGGGEEAVFAAGLRKLTRVTTTAARATLRIERQQVQIEQRLEYRIAHEPQRTFWLTAPRGVVTGGSLQVLLDGEPVTATPAPEIAPANPALTRWQFSTPTDQIGAFGASVRYSIPLDWDRKAALPLTIPHILPAEDEQSRFTGQQVDFVLSDGSTIEPDLEGIDEQAEPIAIGSGTAHAYTWSSPTSFSHWTLELGQGVEPTSVSVSQMWVQSWLTPEVRQERVALRMSTTQEEVRLRLPKRVRQATVQTAIDGREVESKFRVPGLLVVPLPPAALGRECVLEVCFGLDPPEQHFGLMNDELRTAQVDQAAAPRRVYWQLVLPGDLHLVSSPAEMAAEMAWPVRGPADWLAGRRAVMDQAQLEAWIKASRQESLPLGANEYLFGGLGRWPVLNVVTAQRRLVVAVASGGILALGLLLIHVRLLRSPGVLLAAAVVLAGITWAEPSLGLLAGQGAMLGTVVMVAAVAWTWISSARGAFRSPGVSVGASRPREGSSMHGAAQRLERSSRITTTASPGPLMEARP